MQEARRVNASVHWYLEELGARVVACSGRARDRHHLGRLVLRALRDAPDALCQIDGGTGESELNGALASRSVRCARALRGCGLRTGDVIALAAPNHLHLAVPFYAALFAGVAVAPIDCTLTVNELKDSLSITRPKIIFCQSEKAEDVQLALDQLELRAHIVTFDAGDAGGAGGRCTSLQQFVDTHAGDEPEDKYECADFDPQETLAMLTPTSGTTGAIKYAAGTHYNFVFSNGNLWCREWQFPTPTRLMLVWSPLQWLTAIMALVTTAILRIPRLQTSLPLTTEHLSYLINTYKPSFMILSPTAMTALAAQRDPCDITCFDTVHLGGSAVSTALLEEIQLFPSKQWSLLFDKMYLRRQRISPHTEVLSMHGMTELTSPSLAHDRAPDAATGSCGRPMHSFQYRLVDLETGKDITEPNVHGELLMKGPGLFKGYYNDAPATAATFAPGGWLRTGDLFYRDERWNFYFVERIKLLLKYKNHQISPVELEEVIRRHPGVLDAAVTGVPEPACGELPVALVVRRPQGHVSAQEIVDLVRDSLSESKQLRGGVVFVPALPLTASGKLRRRALNAALAAALAAARARGE